MSIWDETTKVEDYPDHGIWRHYMFDNGLGASVIQTKFSFGGTEGLWEMATRVGDNYTGIPGVTREDGLAGWLTQAEVCNLLTKIKAATTIEARGNG